VLEYAARSLKQHGFNNIVFIGDSGSNQDGQNAVAAALNAEWAGTGTRAHAIPGYYRSDPEGDAAIMDGARNQARADRQSRRPARHLADDGGGPPMVRNDTIVAQDSTNGIQGDPRGSTPEIGHALLDKNIGRTVEIITQSSPRG
jgi:creatinine amidohydrolase/Fe(II)-dependent formamide hydrolase-like protein